MNYEQLRELQNINEDVPSEQLINIIRQLSEEIYVNLDTISQMQKEIDNLEDQLDFYRTETYLGV